MKYIRDKIPANWEIVTFRDVAELRHGYQFRNYDFTEDGVKVFKITQIKGDGIADISSCSFIDANRIDEFERVLLNKGDILIALTGATIGKVARFNFDEIVLQNYRVGNFFPLSEEVLDKEYFYQFLKSKLFYNQILANQTQSAQQNIGKEDINNMSVVLPPLPEQKAIANILSAIDDKIENNLAINNTLEDMARALYKHWFVDFGPFQDGEFIDSELGPIPKGSEVRRLGDLVEKLSKGTTPRMKDVGDLDCIIPFLKVKDVNDIGVIDKSGLSYIPEKIHLNQLKRSILMNGDLLFSIAGTIGRVSIVPENLNNSNCNQALAFIRLSDKSKYNTLIYNWLKSEEVQNEIESSIVQGVQANVSLTVLKELQLVIPNNETMVEFSKKINPIHNLILDNQSENQNLNKLRDTLLPNLISGEVRLKEFQEQIESVL